MGCLKNPSQSDIAPEMIRQIIEAYDAKDAADEAEA